MSSCRYGPYNGCATTRQRRSGIGGASLRSVATASATRERRNPEGVNLAACRSFGFELQGPCAALTSWRARKRYTQALALTAHDQKLVLRHVAFALQQLFQISLKRRLRFNHRVEGFLHLGRQIICIDVLPLQFFPCHALLQ